MRHTVVISDIHLCEVEPSTGQWMRYRQRACLPDGEIGRMLDALCLSLRGEPMTLVLGGDIFDFDAPRVIQGTSEFHDLPRTAEHTVPALAAMLDDHPLFVEAIGNVLKQGHEVVFVSGNHDAPLTLPEARSILSSRLVDAALAERPVSANARATLATRIHFRAWFHLTPDKILIEHGHQYDPYCAYRYPMAPYLEGEREIVPTIGSIGTRVLVSRMGYFNPHVDRSFEMTKLGYAWHWIRYYLFTRKSVAWMWIFGMTSIVTKIIGARQKPTRIRARANILACVQETGAGLLATARHARLLESPADAPGRIARDLWADRVLVVLLSFAIGVVVLAKFGMPWGLLGLLAPFVVFPLYNRFAPQPCLSESWERVTSVMQRIADVHGARAVVFGHTHNPFGVWENGVFRGNTGSWSAAVSTEHGELLVNERPLVWLTTDDVGVVTGGLYAWKNGAIDARVVRSGFARPRHGVERGLGDEARRNEPRQEHPRNRNGKRDQKEHREADLSRELTAQGPSHGGTD